jgi:hypothetical protein
MISGNEIDQLLGEVEGLFGAGHSFNAPTAPAPQRTSPAATDNLIDSSGGYAAPIHGDWRSSGGFTYQPSDTHPTGHMGVDMRAPAGTPVHPLAPGVVSNVGTDPMGGNIVNIAHANNVKTYYAHLSTAQVQKGDKVDINTVIGTVGNTGNASHTFPHLHFQVWKDGQIQDPARFFSVPAYTNMTPQEKANGPWVSEQAKQEAAAFNMQEHLAQRRAAFSQEVERLYKVADIYYQLVSVGSHKLLHGTSTVLLGGIRANGLINPYLTDDRQIADYFAQEAAETAGGSPIVIEVSVEQAAHLRPDYAMYQEPLWQVKAMHQITSDDDWHQQLDQEEIPYPKSVTDWATSLSTVHSVRYEGTIPAKNIKG